MTYTKTLAWTLVAGMMLGSVGCVSQKQADDLQTLYRRSQEQVIDLKAQLDECNRRVTAMSSVPKPQPQPAQVVQDPNLLAKLQSLQSERARLNSPHDYTFYICTKGLPVFLSFLLLGCESLQSFSRTNPYARFIDGCKSIPIYYSS